MLSSTRPWSQWGKPRCNAFVRGKDIASVGKLKTLTGTCGASLCFLQAAWILMLSVLREEDMNGFVIGGSMESNSPIGGKYG